MQYDEFIAKVAERTGYERDQAAAVTRATLATLAARITRGEAADLAAQLPKELKDPLLTSGPDEAKPFDLAEFERRVAVHAGIPEDQVENAVRTVFATISEAVSGGEFDEVLAQLPDEFGRLVTAAGGSAG